MIFISLALTILMKIITEINRTEFHDYKRCHGTMFRTMFKPTDEPTPRTRQKLYTPLPIIVPKGQKNKHSIQPVDWKQNQFFTEWKKNVTK